MRDLMFAIAMLMVIPLAIVRPVNAYLVWGWTAVLIPTSYLFGFMQGARLNFLFAMIAILLVLFRRVDWSLYKPNRTVWIYLLLLTHATIAFLLGFDGNKDNGTYYEVLAKVMVFCLLMPMFIHQRLHIHAMVMVIVFGMGIHGVLDGLKTLSSGGAHNMYGPRGSMIYDRNHLSTALAVVLPLAYFLYQYARHRIMRMGFLAAFALIVLAIMAGGSRGGFIALAVVGFWLILTSRRRWSTLLIVATLGSLLFVFAPERWTSRLSTIETADSDASFMGRVVAWKISAAIAVDNPVFGGGFHAVQYQPVWDRYKDAPSPLDFLNIEIPPFKAKAAHSIYFEVMGDQGFVGLLIFLGMLSHALYSRGSIKRMAQELGPRFTWARDLGDMLMLSVLAYMTGGASVSVAYLELIYMVVMLMEILRVHVRDAHVAEMRARKVLATAERSASPTSDKAAAAH